MLLMHGKANLQQVQPEFRVRTSIIRSADPAVQIVEDELAATWPSNCAASLAFIRWTLCRCTGAQDDAGT